MNMKTFGIILIVAGVLALAFQGFTYTQREKVLDIGPIEAHADKEKHVYLPPILGVAAILGGAVLVYSGGRKGV